MSIYLVIRRIERGVCDTKKASKNLLEKNSKEGSQKITKRI